MKTLLGKEIRLLLPAYGTALLLATVPVWLFPKVYGSTIPEPAFYLFCFGTMMLALSSFGREFSLKTFPLILAQPVERKRIWWTKVGLLAAAMATVLGAWCLCCAARGHAVFAVWGQESSAWREALFYGGPTAVVAFVGGLWTTLLLRQVAAAFWFTLLVPSGILVVLAPKAETEPWILPALGLYAVAAFWWAWRYFLRVEEAGWTGGEISFPGRPAASAASQSVRRAYRPLAALLGKELQLHLVGLAGMAGLFVLHLGMVAVRKAGAATFGDALRSALELFGGIWLIVPLLVGGPSVAEERKLGTLQEQLCQPVSRRVQFIIKLAMVLMVGGLLSAVLVWTAEGISGAVGLRSSMGRPFQGSDLAGLACLFMVLALLSFYASTLARNLVQALAVAVVTVLGVGTFTVIASGPIDLIWNWLWRGALVYYITWPTLAVALLWLAWRNFRTGAESEHLWRRNLLALAAVLVISCGVTAAIYHRAWEWLTPLEPAHGPARLAGDKPVKLKSDGWWDLTVLLPDGRMLVERFGHQPGRQFLGVGPALGFNVGRKWENLSGNPEVAGSNWVNAVVTWREVVGIRADGTLWVSEKPRSSQYWHRPAEPAAGLVRFGQESSWQSVVPQCYPWSVLLLKQDGTLWRWGTNSFSDRMVWPGLRAFEPQRLTSQTGWTKILSGGSCVYAWKSDGSAWVIRSPKKAAANLEGESGVVLERVPSFDNKRWRSLARFLDCRAGVCEDGSLWAWIARDPWAGAGQIDEDIPARIERVGRDTNWVAVAGEHQRLTALKADGSLWKWDRDDEWKGALRLLTKPPVRLSTHSDWVGLASGLGNAVSLAADGSLWYWGGRWDFDQPMLGPSRKPVRLDNILGP